MSEALRMKKNGKDQPTISLDGETVPFSPGETLFEIADRHGRHVPTLCYDPRLEAFGGCRLCVVEVEGWSKPVASCTTKAGAGMVVRTQSAGLERHRKVLLEMVASENREIDVDPLSGYASQELSSLMDRYEARTGRFSGMRSGRTRRDDPNPFILRDYDNCISCYRCVRVCAEQEGDYAISIRNRGFDTRITVEFDGFLKDSECTFCGQCVHTCPTGALADLKALSRKDLPGETVKTRTICPVLRGGMLRRRSEPERNHGGHSACHGRAGQRRGTLRQRPIRLGLRSAPRPSHHAADPLRMG